MKVAFFHDVRLKKYNEIYYTSGGLTNDYLQKYLKYFTDITLCVREENVEKKNIEELSIVSGKNINFDTIRKIKIFSLLFGKQKNKIKENIIKNDFSIIRMPSFIGMVACREANKNKKKYWIEMVTDPLDTLWNHGNRLGKIIAPIIYVINRHFVKKAENVIYVTDKFLQKKYPNKKNNIGCSDVNLEELSDSVLQARLEKIEAKEQNEIIKIGLIGSLNVKHKGHKVAIKAISKLKDKYNIELHFLGAGDKANWINIIKKYKVSDIVHFDGTLPSGQQVYNWIDKLDIYIMPSLTEGMPRSLIEAMSRACPCIGSNVGGIPELIGEECIVPRKNEKELAYKIIELIEDKDKMKSIAKRNFYKSQEYERNKLEEKMDKFRKEVLDEGK